MTSFALDGDESGVFEVLAPEAGGGRPKSVGGSVWTDRYYSAARFGCARAPLVALGPHFRAAMCIRSTPLWVSFEAHRQRRCCWRRPMVRSSGTTSTKQSFQEAKSWHVSIDDRVRGGGRVAGLVAPIPSSMGGRTLLVATLRLCLR